MLLFYIIASCMGMLLIVFIICVCFSYKQVYELMHPKRNESRLNDSITYEKFEFESYDGCRLKGIVVYPNISSIGTILVCHYLGGSKESTVPFVNFLIAHGYTVVSFDYRNHGESDKSKKVKVCLEDDFQAFYQYVLTLNVNEPFGIIGFSMGCTASIYAICHYDLVKAAVFDSGPLIMVEDYFHYVLKSKGKNYCVVNYFAAQIFLHFCGFKKLAENTKRNLASLNDKPVFFIHGNKDNIIKIENSELAYQIVGSENAVIWKVSHSRHLTNRFLFPNEYESRVIQFFDANLIGEAEGVYSEKSSTN